MDPAAYESLTPAERTCLRASLGRTNEEVAQILGVSPNTVKTQLVNARRKLGSPPKGAAALGLVAWEQAREHHPFRVSPKRVMVDPPDAGHEAATGTEAVHEERATFDFGEAASRPGPPVHSEVPQDDLTNRLQILWQLARLVLAVITTVLLAGPLSEGYQGFANLIYPYTH